MKTINLLSITLFATALLLSSNILSAQQNLGTSKLAPFNSFQQIQACSTGASLLALSSDDSGKTFSLSQNGTLEILFEIDELPTFTDSSPGILNESYMYELGTWTFTFTPASLGQTTLCFSYNNGTGVQQAFFTINVVE